MTIVWAVIFFGMLIFFHELGHFILAKLVGVKVLKFSLGFGPRLFGTTIGETEYVLSAIPLGGYVKPLGEEPGEDLAEDEKHRAFNYQTVWKRAAIIIAGPLFNLVLAYLIFVVFLGINLPVAIPDIDSITTSIENVVEGSPAEEAGLKSNDSIMSINGSTMNDWNEMAAVFAENPGKELEVEVKRGEEILNIVITPEPTKTKDTSGSEVTVGRIGISKQNNLKVIESSGIIDAPWQGLKAVYEWCALTVEVMIRLFTGNLSTKQLGGPILIVDAAAKAASVGAFAYFNFIAIISINLAILNLLPVPVLDGGHLLFLTVESLRGKPLSDKILVAANKTGMALLLILITFVLYNDITRVIVPWVQKTFIN
jgi:regulator of sigma E protease